jgi:hypothetical protein
MNRSIQPPDIRTLTAPSRYRLISNIPHHRDHAFYLYLFGLDDGKRQPHPTDAQLSFIDMDTQKFARILDDASMILDKKMVSAYHRDARDVHRDIIGNIQERSNSLPPFSFHDATASPLH